MKLENKTKYRADDLRRFFMAGIKAAGAEGVTQIVTAKPTKKHHSGLAACPGRWIRIWLPPPGKLNLATLARVFEHEVTHNLGVHHGDMDPSTKHCASLTGGELPEWAKGLEIRLDETPPPITMGERIAGRADHALKMMERWIRKRDTAIRQTKKWTKKVVYYDRKRKEGK